MCRFSLYILVVSSTPSIVNTLSFFFFFFVCLFYAGHVAVCVVSLRIHHSKLIQIITVFCFLPPPPLLFFEVVLPRVVNQLLRTAIATSTN